MPELPDVEIYRKYLQSTALHQKIAKADTYCPRVLSNVTERQLKSALKGHSFTATRRHGKHLFAALDAGKWLVLHFGMTGFLVYFKDDEKQPAHVCLLLFFHNGYHLAYDCQRKLGQLSIAGDVESYIKKEGMGPDAMDPELSFATFEDRIGKGRAMIKSALMDQERIAGIGNIYADEILFQAGINPKAKAGQLDEKALRALFKKRKDVLTTAIDRQAHPEDFPRTYIIPRRQNGAACPKCKAPIETVKVSGRTTYYCPKCQT